MSVPVAPGHVGGKVPRLYPSLRPFRAPASTPFSQRRPVLSGPLLQCLYSKLGAKQMFNYHKMLSAFRPLTQ